MEKIMDCSGRSREGAGANITDGQIEELKRFKDDINYEVAEKKEKEFRHDVMAHIHAYGEQCPTAKGIIHLGATSSMWATIPMLL
jgi:adenylosuccinate lyase